MLEAFQRGEDMHKQTAAALSCPRLLKPSTKMTDKRPKRSISADLRTARQRSGDLRSANYGVAFNPDAGRTAPVPFFYHYQGLARWHHQGVTSCTLRPRRPDS